MLRHLSKKIRTSFITASAVMLLSVPGYAATSEIDQMINDAQYELDQLQGQKNEYNSDEVNEKINLLEERLEYLYEQKENETKTNTTVHVNNDYSLQQQIVDLQNQLYEQQQTIQRLEAERVEATKAPEPVHVSEPIQPNPNGLYGGYDNDGNRAYGTTANFLVNPAPGPNQGEVSYTQDAINAQGASRMVFRYSPNQLYKIYCRTGYLTDLEFKKGERITFAGGGDTSAWAVNSTVVDGVPHLYIKPVVETSATNLIVTTDHHSYQILLNVSDWYNPMVSWSYDTEDATNNLLGKIKEEKTTTANFGVTSFDALNFDYEVSGPEDYRPIMVCDDGKKTIIKINRSIGSMPVLFGLEKGKNKLSMVNYKIKDNCFLIEKIFNAFELRYSDNQVVTIRRK